MNKRAGNYAVGYGKPPAGTRFQKGHSGNPKGRPRVRRSPQEVIEAALRDNITVMENGVPRRIEMREAFVKSIIARAIKGDTRAAGLLLRLMQIAQVIGPTAEELKPKVVVITKLEDNF
jgi:hypothetical protein